MCARGKPELAFSIPALRLPLEFAGAGFLLWLASSSIRAANSFPGTGAGTDVKVRIGPFVSTSRQGWRSPRSLESLR
jgi:threonine/homoserine/homoserine lactone efflux protein